MLNLTLAHLAISSTSLSPLFASSNYRLSFSNGYSKFSFTKLFYQIPNLQLRSSTFERSLDSIVSYTSKQTYENKEFTGKVDQPFIVVEDEELIVHKCIFKKITAPTQCIKYNAYNGKEKKSAITECTFSDITCDNAIVELITPYTYVGSNCFYKIKATQVLHLADDPTKYRIDVNYTTITDHTVSAYSLKTAAFNVTIHNVNISKGQITAQAIHIEYKGYVDCFLNSINDCKTDTMISLISSVPNDRDPLNQENPEIDTCMFANNEIGSNYFIISSQTVIHISNCVFSNNSKEKTVFSCGASKEVAIYNCWFDIEQPASQYNVKYSNIGFNRDAITVLQLDVLNVSDCKVWYDGEGKKEVGIPVDYAGDADDSESDGLSSGAVAGIVVGTVVVVGAVAGVVVWKFVCAGAAAAAAA